MPSSPRRAPQAVRILAGVAAIPVARNRFDRYWQVCAANRGQPRAFQSAHQDVLLLRLLVSTESQYSFLRLSLAIEQRAFSFHAPTIARQGTIIADHAVAGDRHSDGVGRAS